ncbi:MAG: PrsW family intramembrane metalloprotease [Lachnospiraceae bacterium]|nr:PrsW family intramembrane metalloprotease [Candidatus Darwinimomas equi]
MLFFLSQAILAYHWLLIIAAVIPAIVMMVKVYRSDRIEKESPQLLWSLIVGGVLSTLLALIEETVGQWILAALIPEDSPAFNIIMFFVVVAISEETSKYIMMKSRTWKNPEFNCQYDGVVYALFTSLGFALWENISYVLSYGFSTALVRAITAIPGHASFGVFMGVFYGAAKKASANGDEKKSRLLRFVGIFAAVIMHGAYDYLATMADNTGSWWFLVYMIALFIVAFITVSKASQKDTFIQKG